MRDSIKDYENCMLLSAAGDALGFRNQLWEYCKSGVQIHRELEELGGLSNIKVKKPDWPVSDDTVMHLATAEGISSTLFLSREEMYLYVASKYKDCMSDMEGRKPGPTSIKGCNLLAPNQPKGYRIPYNPTATGCGAAMRSMCLGLRFPREVEVEELIAVSIECGRMTHHHPTGFLGSLTSALFTSYAIQGVPVVSWGLKLVREVLPAAWRYIEKDGYCVDENEVQWEYYYLQWRSYLIIRSIQDGTSQPVFPEKYGVEERDDIYKTFSLDGWAGRSGIDAPMIAYDALLASGNSWKELCSRAMFHGGDSDSTGVIAAAWYAILYGTEGVPTSNYDSLEYKPRLLNAAALLWTASHN